jgi:glycine/D-amino acid oxidase-like deaminating enzyme
VLWLAAGDDSYTAATRETLERGSFPVETLEAGTLRRRFPQMDCTGIGTALLEPHSGVLMARRLVRALAADLARRGARITRAEVVAPSERSVRSVQTLDGRPIAADGVVFACGAWLPRVLPVLEGVIRPTRQVVVYFGTPSGDDRFSVTRFPAWIDFPAGIYGLPDADGRGVKVGIDEHGAAIDPDHADRVADRESIDRARAWLARRIPALGAAPVAESRVCVYENSTNGDLLIDRHPAHENVWIAGGGSGHGFKHGPAVGELVAGMVMRGETPPSRFNLAAKSTDARRTVY